MKKKQDEFCGFGLGLLLVSYLKSFGYLEIDIKEKLVYDEPQHTVLLSYLISFL